MLLIDILVIFHGKALNKDIKENINISTYFICQDKAY